MWSQGSPVMWSNVVRWALEMCIAYLMRTGKIIIKNKIPHLWNLTFEQFNWLMREWKQACKYKVPIRWNHLRVNFEAFQLGMNLKFSALGKHLEVILSLCLSFSLMVFKLLNMGTPQLPVVVPLPLQSIDTTWYRYTGFEGSVC